MNWPKMVAAIVSLNDGSLVGKTRLQKTVYLLDRCGMNSGLEFEYHNYGPFSADLASSVDLAELEGYIEVESKPGFHEVPYSVFEATDDFDGDIGELDEETARQFLATMKRYTAIDLELAATIDFLVTHELAVGDVDKAVTELKPLKATAERLTRAHALLGDLGLEE
jgi:uncharacterized protein YwgA